MSLIQYLCGFKCNNFISFRSINQGPLSNAQNNPQARDESKSNFFVNWKEQQKVNKPVNNEEQYKRGGIIKQEDYSQKEYQREGVIPKQNSIEEREVNVNRTEMIDDLDEKETEDEMDFSKKGDIFTKPELLLNLSLDESNVKNENIETLPNSIPSDLFAQTTQQHIDLLGEPSLIDNASSQSNIKSDNLNLLNDIFENPPNQKIDNKLNTPLTPTKSNVSAPSLSRNTSTPNLTKLDPLAELGSFLSASHPNATSINAAAQKSKSNPTPIHRVSSYNTFQNSNSNGNNRPDYNRSHFSEVHQQPAAQGVNAKINEDHFEDLLGGFKRSQNDNSHKTMAQMKKEEMVI